MSFANYSVAYEETQSNRVSVFRNFVRSLFPKAILFDFYLTPEVSDILKLLWSNISSFHNIFSLLLDFYVQTGTSFSAQDKRVFEISEVEITMVDCTKMMLARFLDTARLLSTDSMMMRTLKKSIRLGGLGRIFYVCFLTHWRSTGGVLLLQYSSGVV